MNDNLLIHALQNWLFYYGLLNIMVVLMMVWIVVRLHRAEKTLADLKAGCCKTACVETANSKESV